MCTPENRVERLALATDYRQLHDAFAGMASAARGSEEPERLAASIDEALHRLRRERARDEDELKDVEARYEEFKDEQSGVFGWLRRKLPFTETRREDKAHRAEVADQEAEILADNLFIARSQMLKENLLPPAQRAMGDEPEDWERRLAADEHVSRIKAYAQGVVTLAEEVRRGRGFVSEVSVDVDAFADAEFKEEDDQRRRKADLAAAREEVRALERTLRAKRSLREGAIDRARGLITKDLEANDPSYRASLRRVTKLEEALMQAQEAETRLKSMRDAVEEMKEAADGLEGLDAKRLDLARRRTSLREGKEAAERRCRRADTLATERSDRAEAARDAVREAESAVRAARSAHEAHLAESLQVELPTGVGFEDSSPAAAELVRAEESLKEARAEERDAGAPYEEARAEADAARREVRDAERELKDCERADQRLARDEEKLRDAWSDAGDRLRSLANEVSGFFGSYSPRLESASELGMAATRIERQLDSARSERAALEEDRDEERRRIDSTWAKRSQDLLGDDLVSALF